MKSLCMVFTLLLTILGSTVAQADSWRSGRGYDGHRGYSSARWSSNHHNSRNSHRKHWNFGSRSYNRYNSGHYSSYGYSRRNNYVNLSFGNHSSWRRRGYSHSHYNSHDAGSFIGGLVVGGLISSSLNRDYQRRHSTEIVRTRVVSAPTVIRGSTVSSSPRIISTGGSRSAPAVPRTRLLRDLQGQCFEISYAEDGTEQRAQLADEACSF